MTNAIYLYNRRRLYRLKKAIKAVPVNDWRFNALADKIRSINTLIREEYYSVTTGV